MSFTLDQNVSGAAFAAPVVSPANTPSVIGGLLDVAASYSKGQRSRSERGPTQTDRDRQATKGILQQAQADLAAGVPQEAIAKKYGADFATLNPNPQELVLFNRLAGDSAFVAPKAVVNLADVKTDLFNQNSPTLQLGFIQQEIETAAANGESISESVASARAVERFAMNQQAASVGIMQGNIDFSMGFDQNMKTLDSFTTAVTAVLGVEQGGKDFSLKNLRQMQDGWLILKSQGSFQKPNDKLGLEKWGVMEAKMDSIDKTFEALENYDLKFATSKAKAAMARLVLSGDSVYATMAMTDPAVMAQVAALANKDLLNQMKNSAELAVVDYSTLDFDPVILELMGETTVDGKKELPTPLSSETAFPASVEEQWIKDAFNPEKQAQVITFNTGIISAIPSEALSVPDTQNAFASGVTAAAFALTKNETFSSKSLNSLISSKVINNVRALEALGGKSAETALILKGQMSAALEHNATKYGVNATGRMQAIPSVFIDWETKKFVLEGNENPSIQSLGTIVSLYYNGDFEALWKDGPKAKLILQNRLASQGKITPDSPEFAKFDAATEVLEKSLWKGMAAAYGPVKGIPQQLQAFKDMSKKLGVTLEEVAGDTAFAKEAVETVQNSITTTVLPDRVEGGVTQVTKKGRGTRDDPYDFSENLSAGMTEADLKAEIEAIKEGYWYRTADGKLRKKRGADAPTNFSKGDGDPLGKGIPVPKSRAEYDALPAGSKWVDPTGKIRTKKGDK